MAPGDLGFIIATSRILQQLEIAEKWIFPSQVFRRGSGWSIAQFQPADACAKDTVKTLETPGSKMG